MYLVFFESASQYKQNPHKQMSVASRRRPGRARTCGAWTVERGAQANQLSGICLQNLNQLSCRSEIGLILQHFIAGKINLWQDIGLSGYYQFSVFTYFPGLTGFLGFTSFLGFLNFTSFVGFTAFLVFLIFLIFLVLLVFWNLLLSLMLLIFCFLRLFLVSLVLLKDLLGFPGSRAATWKLKKTWTCLLWQW